MAWTVAAALANNNAFDVWVGEMMEHNPTFTNMTNPDRFQRTNRAKQHMKGTKRDDKAAPSTLAASLKRWDDEVGTGKRAQQRNKRMAKHHTKSLV